MSDLDRNIWAVDAIAEAAAEFADDEGPATREERAAEAQYLAFVTERLAALRRTEFEQTAPVAATRRAVRASIVAMTREAILARLAAIRLAHPGIEVGFAHHKQAALTMRDHDLRTALEDAERAIEDG